MKTVLITAATGDAGRAVATCLLEKGFNVRALARKEDVRTQYLQRLGAELVIGDAANLRDLQRAMHGIQIAYFCFPFQLGWIENAAIFAQAAKVKDVELIVNMSHKPSRSEQIFNWSGIPAIHLRVTFFTEWLLHIAPMIRRGRYLMPHGMAGLFSPLAARDLARIVAGVMDKPEPHIGKAITLYGPSQYSHEELAAEIGQVLGRSLLYERVPLSIFLELFGLRGQAAMRYHFEAVLNDPQEYLLPRANNAGLEIIARPFATVKDFVNEHRLLFEPSYFKEAA